MKTLSVLPTLLSCFISVSTNASTLEASQSQVVESDVDITKAIRLSAERWNIEPTEYQRYTELLKGPLGKWNPNIDPLLALGMFAENPTSRQRFAELYAQQEFTMTQRALQFQASYQQAFNRLYPNQPVIDSEKLKPFRQNRMLRKQSLQTLQNLSSKLITGDQVFAFFPKNCPSCDATLSRLMQTATNIKGVSLRVFILEAQGNSDVVAWSEKHNVQDAWLKSGILSLNRDEGLLNRLRRQSGSRFRLSHPMYLLREGRYYDVNLEMNL